SNFPGRRTRCGISILMPSTTRVPAGLKNRPPAIMKYSDLKFDCRFFRGDIPCSPHKEHGVHCVDADGNSCPYYDPTTKRFLVTKLGAIGDVIRTTPLLHKLKE